MSKFTKNSKGLYRTSVSIGYTDDGRPKKKYFSASTIKELERKVSEFKSKIADGINWQEEEITFGEYAQKWLTTYKSQRGIRTQEMYARAIEKYLNSLFDMKVKDIRRVDIQSQITALHEHPRTAEQVLLTAKQIFDSAVKDDIIRKSPVTDIEKPRHVKEEKRALTKEEKAAVKSADLTVRERAFVSLLYGTGMRPAEVYALTWEDIDFKNNEISVNKSLTFRDGTSPVVTYPKTNSGIRVVQCPTWLINALKDYKAISSAPILFNNKYGRYREKQTYYRAWARIKKKIEIQLGYESDISMYCFRHNYATEIYYAGISLLEAQRLLGHSSHEMIMKIYSHLDSERENTANKLNEIDF